MRRLKVTQIEDEDRYELVFQVPSLDVELLFDVWDDSKPVFYHDTKHAWILGAAKKPDFPGYALEPVLLVLEIWDAESGLSVDQQEFTSVSDTLNIKRALTKYADYVAEVV